MYIVKTVSNTYSCAPDLTSLTPPFPSCLTPLTVVDGIARTVPSFRTVSMPSHHERYRTLSTHQPSVANPWCVPYRFLPNRPLLSSTAVCISWLPDPLVNETCPRYCLRLPPPASAIVTTHSAHFRSRLSLTQEGALRRKACTGHRGPSKAALSLS